MDILQRKLLDSGADCYIIRASLDHPFVYLRFSGRVIRRYTNNDIISYHVQITDVLEDKDMIRQFMNRSRFRTYNENNGRVTNQVLYTYDILDDAGFQQKFTNRYRMSYFDLHSSLVFESAADMQTAFSKANGHLINKLKTSLNILKSR